MKTIYLLIKAKVLFFATNPL